MRTGARRLSAFTGLALLLVGLIPAAADAASPPGTPQAASDRCFIGVAHSIFLDRPATEAEKQAWSDRFEGGEPRYRLPQELATSDEWLTVVITGLYRDALDRGPDGPGLTYWISQLRAGALVNRVASQIYGSDEYYADAGGTPTAFVTDIYTRILGRAPDAAGQAYWEGQVSSLGRGRVAALFFASVESRRDRVDALYEQILGRAADDSGRAYWIDQLATVNDVRLAVLLASSPEAIDRSPGACTTTVAITDGDRGSYLTSISADGDVIAFDSEAGNLVPGDVDPLRDVFVVDRSAGTTTRITDGPSAAIDPVLSGDGRHVVFYSQSSDLVPGDLNGQVDLYTFDLTLGTATQVTDGNGTSAGHSATHDGGLIVFASLASNLVPGDTNGHRDIFTWDRTTGTTTRIVAGNGASFVPSVSADGDLVAFHSDASDLVPGDTNGQRDVFVWDRTTGTTTRLTDGSGGSSGAKVSSDGGHVTFASEADDIVPNDTNGATDVFLWERATGETTRLSDGNGDSYSAAPSSDGGVVAFVSTATDLVPGAGAHPDVFRWDRVSGTTRALTRGTAESARPAITPDGRHIVFESFAANLTIGDTNRVRDIFLATYLG